MEPINLAALTWQQWTRGSVALIVYLGPGLGIAIGYAQRKHLDKTQLMVIAIGSALAGWTVFYAWLNLLNISISATSMIVISVIAWLYFCVRIWRAKPTQSSNKMDLFGSIKSLMLWATILAVLGFFLWMFKDIVAGLGSDSYHHTLISQLIYEQGQLPENYLPYAPLVTFRYHFGYHAMVATLSTLSGIIPRLMVLISGPLLLGLAALSTGYLAETMSQDRLAAVIAAVITGLVAVFPAYMLNWARYPQLAGLALLPILLGICWRWMSDGFPRRDIPWISLLAAGLALTHYRVAIMAMVGILSLFIFHCIQSRRLIGMRKIILVNGISSILLAAFLTMPWIIHVARSYLHQSPTASVVSTGTLEDSFFSISRLGQGAIDYPTNLPLMITLAVVLIIDLFSYRRRSLPMFAWALGLMLLSGPAFAGTAMDTVSIVISLYIPTAVIIAVGVVDNTRELQISWKRNGARIFFLMVVAMLVYFGHSHSQRLLEPSAVFVHKSDLDAAQWIQENTPEDAFFMVDIARFGFSERFIIGIDAGYWLPLNAHRQTISMPMVYELEAAQDPEFLNILDELENRKTDITTPQFASTLSDYGITHIFIGRRDTYLRGEKLIQYPNLYQLLYENNNSWVFSVKQ